MKTAWAFMAIAITVSAAHPLATNVDISRLRQPPSFASAPLAIEDTGSVWNGRWEGTTVSGQPLVLQLQLQGQRITGRLKVGKQSANIMYGKVVGEAFALTTGPIDGHSVDATGRHVGDTIELTIEGVKEPLKLTRVP
jgi:hypothetical protein